MQPFLSEQRNLWGTESLSFQGVFKASHLSVNPFKYNNKSQNMSAIHNSFPYGPSGIKIIKSLGPGHRLLTPIYLFFSISQSLHKVTALVQDGSALQIMLFDAGLRRGGCGSECYKVCNNFQANQDLLSINCVYCAVKTEFLFWFVCFSWIFNGQGSRERSG